MSEKNTGGPAFPVHNHPGSREFACGALTHGGMTLRDYFAGKALSGICSNPLAAPDTQQHFDNIAEDSYRLADAMLKAREA